MDIDEYETFGAEVFAPVTGKVVVVENSIVDQPVASIDNANPAGNYVVIEIEPEVNVILAHLQQGSIVVEVGDEVFAGQLLGKIGNSGQSSQPHLHIHAMTGQDMLDPEAKPIPMMWQTDGGLVFHKRNEMLLGLDS